MTPHSQLTPEARRAGRRWGAAIVGGLGIVVVVNFWVVWLVKDRGFPLVSESYYQDGLAYDRVIDAGSENVRRQVEFFADRNGRLVVQVGGAPVADVRGVMRFYRADDPSLDYVTPVDVARSREGYVVPLTEPTTSGRWRVTLDGELDRWTTRVTTTWTR